MLDLERTRVVYFHFLEFSFRGHTFEWQQFQHFKLESNGLATTHHALMRDQFGRLPQTNDVEMMNMI